MSESLRVLIVEDSEDDTILVVRELQHNGFEPKWERVETAEAFHEALNTRPWDLIISDYSLPRFNGSEALALLQQMKLEPPFIVVSGAIGEECAVQLMKAGANDYVMKDNLSRLPPVVRRELAAVQERRTRKQAERQVAHLAAIVESCEEAVLGKTLGGIITSWNHGAERLYGYTAAEMIGRSVSVLIPPGHSENLPDILDRLHDKHGVERFETVRLRKDGTSVEVSLSVSPIKDSAGQVVGASTIALDISRRKQEERDRLLLIQSLSDALKKVKALSGLLPICSNCKKIRDDTGYWQAVETYVKEHSEADFTHSVCPDCMKTLYAGYLVQP